MSELYWPPTLIPSATEMSVLDMVGRFPSALNGITQTVGRPGSRLKMSMSFRTLHARNRLLMQRIISASRGGTAPIRCRDHTYTQQGSFPGTELLTNNTFDNGTTGWTAGSEYTISVSDRTLRAQRNAVTGSANLITRSSITVTQYVPYVSRAIVVPGQGAYASGFTAFLASQVSPVASTFGMTQNVYVPVASTAEFRLRDNQSSGPVAGDHVYVPWVSLAQCALVDNGSNLLRHTEEMAENPSFWPNTATSWGDDATAAPNGATVADSLIEDSATSTHYTQGIAACDAATENYCFAVALKAGSRGFARVLLLSTPANTSISCYINLTTGAITDESTGADWLNLRSYSANLGNGWWYVAIVGRKNSSDISLRARIQVASAAGTDSYTGNGTGNIYVWRPTVAQSAVPVRLTNNGATPDTDGTLQNLGGGIYTKGWPASTSGLLLPGDQVEIGGQLQIVTGSVSSDAAGLAFLPLASLRVAPEDDSPVIIVGPLGKWIPEEAENGWTNVPGIFSDAELVLIESG